MKGIWRAFIALELKYCLIYEACPFPRNFPLLLRKTKKERIFSAFSHFHYALDFGQHAKLFGAWTSPSLWHKPFHSNTTDGQSKNIHELQVHRVAKQTSFFCREPARRNLGKHAWIGECGGCQLMTAPSEIPPYSIHTLSKSLRSVLGNVSRFGVLTRTFPV